MLFIFHQIHSCGASLQTSWVSLQIKVPRGCLLSLVPGMGSLNPGYLQHGGWECKNAFKIIVLNLNHTNFISRMCIALFTLTPIWPHQSRFSNAQRTPLMTGSRGGVGPCPCTSCSHSSSSRPSSPCSATRPSSRSSGDLSGSHCFYQSHSLFYSLMLLSPLLIM